MGDKELGVEILMVHHHLEYIDFFCASITQIGL